MVYLIFWILSILFFSIAVCYSQGTKEDKSNSKEVSESLPKPYYKFEVAIANIDVFVVDKYEEPITGLKPENFEIYEDGILQKMTNFYEVKGGDIYISIEDEGGKLIKKENPLRYSEAAEEIKTKIIFYFDNLQMHPLNKSWVIKKLNDFIKTAFSVNYNVGMVVSMDTQLKIIQDFTNDGNQLLQAIDQVSKESSDIMLRLKTREELKEDINRIIQENKYFDEFENLERALGLAQSYVNYVENDLMVSLKNLDSLINFLSGIKGRKIVIYVSDGLPLNPAEEVYSFVDRAFPKGNALSKAMDYDATRLFKEITSRSNAYNISIYTINAMGLDSSMVTADKRTEWDIYSKGFGMMRNQSRFQNAGIQLMAEDTGGVAIVNANNIEVGLQKINKSLNNFYSLGFAVKNKDKRIGNLVVKVVGLKQAYNIRYRKTFRVFSLEERIEDTVMSRLFLPAKDNKLNVSAQVMESEGSFMKRKEVPVSIKILIPLKNIFLTKKDKDYVGYIEVYFAAKDSKDNVSPCYRLLHEIKIPFEDYDKAVKSNYPYLVETKLIADRYLFSLAIRDVSSDIISYIQFEKDIKLD